MKDLVNDGFARVVKPYIDTQNKKDREIVAPVEVSPAEAAHNTGDQIIFDGILYDVTAQIAVGDSLATTGAGANISAADNIETQINDQKTQIESVAAQAAAQNKTTQEMLASVEEDETDASRAYEIGEQLILDGILYNVIDAIAQHGIISSTGAGANIEAADTITEQIEENASSIQNLTNRVNGITDEIDDITDEIDDINNILGAKNLCPNNATTQVINGITYTVNSDGSITANGTATSLSTLFILGGANGQYARVDFSQMIGNGSPSGGSSNTYQIVFQTSQDGSTLDRSYSDYGEGVVISPTKYSAVYIRIASGTTVNNLIFKPMIRPASITDDTYVPYAATNRKLTTKIGTITLENGYTNASCKYTYKEDGSFSITGGLLATGPVTYNRTKIATLNPPISQAIGIVWIGETLVRAYINNGELVVVTGNVPSGQQQISPIFAVI